MGRNNSPTVTTSQKGTRNDNKRNKDIRQPAKRPRNPINCKNKFKDERKNEKTPKAFAKRHIESQRRFIVTYDLSRKIQNRH